MAGVLSSSRRGLVFPFTLLCIFCLASSLTDKNQLEYVKNNHQKNLKALDTLKANYSSMLSMISKHINDYVNFIEAYTAHMKAIPDALDTEVTTSLDKLRASVFKFKAYVEQNRVALDSGIGSIEKELQQSQKIIDCLENQSAEL
ncbi:uncharacterized protein KZ484_016762 [Pholidichthys leucotaenia]